MTLILALLNALVALPKIGLLVEDFARAISLWFVQRANNQTLSAISDAAALGAKAKTDEDRYAAAEAWQKALSRPRVSA